MAYQAYSEARPDDDSGQRTCARDQWCADPRIIRNADGTVTRLPALVYRTYCDCCRSMIAHCLDELPSAYDRLGAEIGEHSRTGGATIRAPFGPRLPLRTDVDALLREMTFILGSWHERTAAVASLTPPDASPQRELSRQVKEATSFLAAHLDVLLALAPEPMARVMPPMSADDWITDPDAGGIVRPDGEAHMWLPLSGADAGNEILRLHYRARRILGETRAAPETFDGVPCKHCETMSLERAEPPSDPTRPAMHSRCATCGHTMTREDFSQWAAWYAQWAARLSLTCKRCQAKPPRCAECLWDRCACATAGHAA